MEILLLPQVTSLTGSLGRGFGYFIQRRGSRFFGQRSKHSVPPDGHLRFIFTAAELARSKLHIADIKVPRAELACAIIEAGKDMPLSIAGMPLTLNAADIIKLKTNLGL